MKKFAVILTLIMGTVFLGGCSQTSQQEKFYKQLNEDRKKSEIEGKNAADATRNMDTSVKPSKDTKK